MQKKFNFKGIDKIFIEDLNVLAFTELPETRKVKVLATIENKNEETK